MMYKIASKNGVARNCIQLHRQYPYMSDRINVKDLPVYKLPVDRDYNVSMVNGHMVYWKDVAIPLYMEHRKDEILGKQMALIDDDVLLGDLYLNADNTITEAMDFGTVGNGPKAVARAMAILEDDINIGCGYNAVVSAPQFYELCAHNQEFFMPDKKVVKYLLQGGDVYKSNIPESTGLILPTAAQCLGIRIVIHNDWDVEIIDELHNIYRVYASFELSIDCENNVCRLENI